MYNLSITARLLAFIIIMLIAQFGSTQNTHFVKRGERPPIDYSSMPKDAYYEGELLIKLSESFKTAVNDLPIEIGNDGYVKFGLSELDNLNKQYEVYGFKKNFNPLIFSEENRNKHEAWGFHLWFTLYFNESDFSITEIIASYKGLSEIEIAEPRFKTVLCSSLMENDNPKDKSDTDAPYVWIPNDPRFNEQWHYHNTGQEFGTIGADISLLQAWAIERGNSNVVVAVFDDGIQYDHEDIEANMWEGIGYNFVDDSDLIVPDNHGTHVAGTVAAITNNSVGVSGVAGGNGLSQGVRLMSCQIYQGENSGGHALAYIWAADNGASIAQSSWSYSNPNSYNQDVLDAIDYFNLNAGNGAILNGGICFFSAGNYNSPNNYYPAFYSGTIAVAATNNRDQKAWYSNYGSWIDISAPGGEINDFPTSVLSTITNNDYEFYQGTSMACPHVSGVAALVVSLAYGKLTKEQLKNIILNNTDDHYENNPDFIGQLGTGRLNAFKSLHAAIESAFEGGDGSVENPYLIADARQLNLIRYYPNLHYELVSDIDLYPLMDVTAEKNNGSSGRGWLPIGYFENELTNEPFSGTIDGNNYKIENLVIKRDDENMIGLFGYVYGATIKNLHLRNVSIEGYQYVGGIAGGAFETTIENCSVMGEITGFYEDVGGLIGLASDVSITGSHSTGHVEGNSNCGGLVGNLTNESEISDSYTTGTIVATGFHCGGLAGINLNSSISDCFSIKTVNGYNSVGGFVGANSSATISDSHFNGIVEGTDVVGGFVGESFGGTIAKCYAEGTVTGTNEAGGFIGYNKNGLMQNSYSTTSVIGQSKIGGFAGWNRSDFGDAIIQFCYSVGSVTGTDLAGGLIGYNQSGIVNDSYWDNESSGLLTSDGGIGKSAAEMQLQETYIDWDFISIWDIVDSETYPFLRAESLQFPGGDGTEKNPYHVVTAEHLNMVRNNLSAHYEQKADIDLSRYSNWEPIGILTGGNTGTPFVGLFNGNFFKIDNLNTDFQWGEGKGLFGFVDGAVLKNIIVDVLIQGNSCFCGGLVAYVSQNSISTITDCFSEGVIKVDGVCGYGGLIGHLGSTNIVDNCGSSVTLQNSNCDQAVIGGLVGRNDASISNSFATGDVFGCIYSPDMMNSIFAGGLVGINAGEIINCYSLGNVKGGVSNYNSHIGGLVGINWGWYSSPNVIIKNSLSTGSVSGIGNIAGFANLDGYNLYVQNSYWNTETSEKMTGGAYGTPSGIIGKNTNEMVAQSTFEGWDFDNTWAIVEGHSYPYLKNNPFSQTPRPFPANLQSYYHAGAKQVKLSWNEIEIASLVGYDIYRNEEKINVNPVPFLVFYDNPIEEDVVNHYFVKAVFTGDEMSNRSKTVDVGISFAGGDGSETNPFLVATPEHLNMVRHYLDSHFLQTSDIDLAEFLSETGDGYNNGQGWEPIGMSSFINFKGVYNGNNSKISNLTIQGNYFDNPIGLFGSCHSCLLKNLIIADFLFEVGRAGEGIGAVLGERYYAASIDNCHVNGLIRYGVVGATASVAGGIAGSASTISNSSANIKMHLNNIHGYTGGICGYCDNISNSFSIGKIISDCNFTGGLSGVVFNVENSYSLVDVYGNSQIGGLVGKVNTSLINCYSAGEVTGQSSTGGLIGVKGTSASITNSYWDMITSGQSTSDGGTGRNTNVMMQQNNYDGWDFVNVWEINPESSYPILRTNQNENLPVPVSVWNGTVSSDWITMNNWNRVPSSYSNVRIPATANNPKIASYDIMNDLDIREGATFTVDPSGAITVNGNLINNGNQGVVLKSPESLSSPGSLILIGSLSGTGTIKAERYIPGYTNQFDGWHLLGAPVDNPDLLAQTNFIPGANDDFYAWDEINYLWLNQKEPENNLTTLSNGIGYLIAYHENGIRYFEGQPVTDDIKHENMSFTAGKGNGWHLLSNPYTSAIEWNNNENWVFENISGIAKILNQSGSYTDIEVGDIIPAMQGFFIQSSSETNQIIIPRESQIHSTNNWSKASKNMGFTLHAHDINQNLMQPSKIRINEDASDGFDLEFDSRFLGWYAPQFFSIIDDERLSVNTINRIDNETVIHFGFIKNQSDEFVIRLVEDVLDHTIYLTDKKTNSTHNLSSIPVYYFKSSMDDEIDRFMIHFSEAASDDAFHAYVYGQQLFINNKSGKLDLQLFDLQGRKLFSRTIDSEGLHTEQLNLSSGIYLVRIQSNNISKSIKVFAN